MKPKGSWFFEGYQAYYEEKPNGKRRKRLVYRGEYYGFRGGKAELRRVKLICALLSALTVLLNLWDQFHPAYGGMDHWMAIPSLLSLVPMIFLLMGLGNLLASKPMWEIRVYYAGYRRLFRAGIGYLCLIAVWFGMELVFMLRHGDLFRAELAYSLVLLGSVAAQIIQLIFIKRHPAVVVQGPEPGRMIS